ncbi:MAG: SDR family oxidoreductase [Candidatus Aenigmarchaeota archaeon]|nr:SDR family oxidoreductase [Candidatus Aenigmarchaeota archaeon]
MDFKNKVAIITGAASGIGKATAYAFAEHSVSVVVADIDPIKGKLVSDYLKRKGYRSIFIETDVSSPAQTDRMASKTLKEYGKIDILVNNAGIEFGDKGNIIDMPYGKLKRILDVNLYGYINCARSVVPHMRERKQGGKIVNVSSVEGLSALLPGTSYQASKSGIIGLTRALAIELAPWKINVNAVAPGAIATEGMGAAHDQKIVEAYRRRIPWGARGFPKDIAGPILFLSSEYARYITGQVLVVDGGYLASITPEPLVPDPHSHPVSPEDPDLEIK